MILAIDIGNTTVALGGIRDGRVCFVARMDTVRTRTAAEYRVEMDKIFAHRRHPERPMRFEGAVLTSVVPQITGALAECARHYTGRKPVIVSPEIRTGLTMGVDEPHAVGKDRLVDAAYAAANFPLPVVTVDLALPRPLMWWTRTACSGAVSSAGAFHRAAGTGRPLCPAAAGASWLAQKRHWHQHRKMHAVRLRDGHGCAH
mgnify:CR=1 FL=1